MDERNRVYKCPNCGANLRYDPESGRIVCDYCDAVFDAADYDPATGRWKSYGERFGQKIVVQKNGRILSEEAAAKQEEEKKPEKSGFWNNEHDDDKDLEEMNEFSCTQCGARIYSTDVTIATFCSYCGSSVVLEKRVVREKKPNFIIPFSVSKEDGENAYRKLLKKSLFAPEYMKKDSEIEKFRGIYMPYWMYNLTGRQSFRTTGKTETRRGDYIYTKHYRVTTEPDIDYRGVCYDASSGFSDNLSQAIAPYDPKKSLPYNAVYLSGFYADAGDVYAGTYREEAKSAVRSDAASELYQKNPVYRQNHVDVSEIQKQIPLDADNEKGLFPVWFLSIRNKTNDRISYAVVNGQTGKAAADIPIDFKKYLLGSLILSIPMFLLFSFLFSFTPKVLTVISIVLSLIALVIANREINRVYTSQNDLDDAGKMSLKQITKKQAKEVKQAKKKKNNSGVSAAAVSVIFIAVIVGLMALMEHTSGGFEIVLFMLFAAAFLAVLISSLVKNKVKKDVGSHVIASAPMSDKKWVYLKLLIAAAVSVLVLIIAPVSDLYYYGASLVTMLLTVLSFLDIIKAYNQLTTRKLPQFDTRGGDADAVS